MEGFSKENASKITPKKLLPKDDSETAAPGGVSAAAALKGVSNEAALKNNFEKDAPTPDDSDEGLPSLRAGSQVDPDPSTSPRPWFQSLYPTQVRGRK